MQKFNYFKIYSIFLVFSKLIYADPIKIHNESDATLYTAIYTVPGTFSFSPLKSTRVVNPVEIDPGEVAIMERPSAVAWSKKATVDRKLIFSRSQQNLKNSLIPEEYKTLGSITIGDTRGKEFYIIDKEGVLKGYNNIEWVAIKPIRDAANKAADFVSEQTLGRLRKSIAENTQYGKIGANLRQGANLSQEEQKYLNVRLPKAKVALEKALNIKLENKDIPRIALCASGGGYRAMVATLGSVMGLEYIDILDSITYFTGLSGSTWFLAPWVVSGKSAKNYKDQLIPRLNEPFTPQLNDLQTSRIIDELVKKYAYGEPISIVDLYGAILSYHLLSKFAENPYSLNLTNLVANVDSGEYPYPIFTALVTRTVPYEWMEFTPHEVGYVNAYVPSWAFGRAFSQGKSTSFAPPQSLGFLMAIWGSAFSANAKEFYNILGKNIKSKLLSDALKYGVEETTFGGYRIAAAKVFNFTKGVSGLPRSQDSIISLIDAGIDCNLPAVPLLRPERKVDIVILLDASQSSEPGSQLRCVEKYAREHNIKFPVIDYKDIGNKNVSVFKGPITVIYIPLVRNEKFSTFDPVKNMSSGGYASTENLRYTPEQTNELSGLTEFNLVSNKDVIFDAIRDVVGARG